MRLGGVHLLGRRLVMRYVDLVIAYTRWRRVFGVRLAEVRRRRTSVHHARLDVLWPLEETGTLLRQLCASQGSRQAKSVLCTYMQYAKFDFVLDVIYST